MNALNYDQSVWELEQPTFCERESQWVCQLIRFILHQRQQPVPSWIHRATDSEYGRADTLKFTRNWLFNLCLNIELEELHHWKAQGYYEAVRLKQWLSLTSAPDLASSNDPDIRDTCAPETNKNRT